MSDTEQDLRKRVEKLESAVSLLTECVVRISGVRNRKTIGQVEKLLTGMPSRHRLCDDSDDPDNAVLA